MKTRFIFNPHSGRRRNLQLVPLIHDFIVARELDADVVATEEPGHATLLAGEAIRNGCERIVAVGGDGTMNEVAQALVGTAAALALVPCGSGNGLALHLGIPTAPRRALELLTPGASRIASIDTATANGHPFFNAMGLGFDADISRRFNRLTRRGLPAYACTGLAAFRRRRIERCVVDSADGRETLDIFVIAVANSDQYGNRAFIAPDARVDDGALDLVAVRPVGYFSAAPLVARLFLGTLDRSRRVRRLRGHRFSIQRPSAGLIHTDGETHLTPALIEIALRPRSLRIVVPRGRSGLPRAASTRDFVAPLLAAGNVHPEIRFSC